MGSLTTLRTRLAAALDAQTQPTDSPQAYGAHFYYPQFISEADGLRAIDDLVSSKGLTAYREMMMRDEQVSSCVAYLIFARLASGFSISAASEDETDKRVAAAVEDNFTRLQRSSVVRLMQNAMDAIAMGFSVQEKILAEPNTSGDFRGLQYYKTFRPIPQETITFKVDPFGELAPDGVWQMKPHIQYSNYTSPDAYNHLPADRFIIWNWQQQNGNPLGFSVLRPAYRWYKWKEMMVRWWAKYMERHGHPWVIAEIEEGTSKETRTAIMRKLSNFVIDRVLLLKPRNKIDFKEPSTTAVANFKEALTTADRGIARCTMMPSLLTEHGDVGSLALGQSQKNVYEWPLMHLGETLQDEVMAEAVLRPFVDHNFGVEIDIPTWKFADYSEPDRIVIATLYKLLKDLGVPVGVDRIRKALGEPAPEPDDLLIGGAEDNPEQGMDKEMVAQAGKIDSLLADIMEASGSKSDDDVINVLRGNGKRSKREAADLWKR